jgi:hypothetical protein
MNGLNGGGGVNAGYNANPNLINLEDQQAQSAAFDKKITNDVMDKPDIYRAHLKELAFALARHEEATSALADSRIVNLCFHLLRRLDEAEARIKALEEK